MALAIAPKERSDEQTLRAMVRSQDDYWMRKLLQGTTIALAALTFFWLLERL